MDIVAARTPHAMAQFAGAHADGDAGEALGDGEQRAERRGLAGGGLGAWDLVGHGVAPVSARFRVKAWPSCRGSWPHPSIGDRNAMGLSKGGALDCKPLQVHGA